jgi:hypothetical protein
LSTCYCVSERKEKHCITQVNLNPTKMKGAYQNFQSRKKHPEENWFYQPSCEVGINISWETSIKNERKHMFHN